MVPISYSVGGEWLHHLIASYKRGADPSVPAAQAELACIFETFLAAHEPCVAAAAGVPEFQLVTTVPSGDRVRDLHHPLRRIAGELVKVTSDRYERLLVRSTTPAIPRVFDERRYLPTRILDGEAVLLIDDMWTSGASAEGAGAALLEAGAGAVAAVVAGRHVNRWWHDNDLRLRRLARAATEQGGCVICPAGGPSTTRPAAAQRGGGGSATN